MKTACAVSLKVRSHPRPCRASPYAPRMVADIQGIWQPHWALGRGMSASGRRSRVTGAPLLAAKRLIGLRIPDIQHKTFSLIAALVRVRIANNRNTVAGKPKPDASSEYVEFASSRPVRPWIASEHDGDGSFLAWSSRLDCWRTSHGHSRTAFSARYSRNAGNAS
jgi:hypothetical protein